MLYLRSVDHPPLPLSSPRRAVRLAADMAIPLINPQHYLRPLLRHSSP